MSKRYFFNELSATLLHSLSQTRYFLRSVMKYESNLSLLMLIVIAFGININTQAQETSELLSFNHNEIDRSYRLYVPENGADKLLMVLHGTGSNARAMEIFTDFNTSADEHSFAIVYPQADGFYWDVTRSGNFIGSSEEPTDDTGFLVALANSITDEYGINTEEVYLTGLNSGGEMAYYTACTQPERFAGLAVVSALMRDYQVSDCPEENSVALNTLIIWGDRNPDYTRNSVLSPEQNLDFWLEHNACNESSQAYPNIEHFSCDDDTETTLVTVQGGGNSWFGTNRNIVNDETIDATELISGFIMQTDDWLDAGQQSQLVTETPRSWVVYVPDTYSPDVPAPLVMLLHGRTGTGESQAVGSAFNLMAEREGVIAVYPQGIDNQWAYTRPTEEDIQTDLPDDDTFLRNLLDELALDLNIDSNRVYVTGISNGGFMAQRLICTMQDKFAAFASVAATGVYRLPELCAEKESVPALYIHGTEDTIVPWDGMTMPDNQGNQVIISASMSQTLGFWGRHNNCGNDLDILDIPPTTLETQTRIINLTDCPENAPVVVYMVINGGHTWHGVMESNEYLGLSSPDFNSSEEIWHFFNQFTLDEG